MDWLYMHMPITGTDIFWPGLLLIGFTVGVLGGFLGMGGAWMVTPGLNILGLPMAYSIGTDVAHMAGKSIVATFRHAKFGNVDYKLGTTMIVGTVTGIECGAQLVMWLERIGRVGPVVRWTYVIVLLMVAVVILADYKKATDNKAENNKNGEKAEGITWYKTLHDIHIPPMMEFPVSGIRCSMWLPIGVTFVTGILAGFLGVGGGFLRMPALIFLLGCPTRVAVGTDLFEVMISGLYGTFTYGVKGRIEVYAVAIMLSAAAVGAQIGSVATKYAAGPGIRIAFALTAIGCTISVILKQFSYTMAATVVIMSAVTVMCIYICIIMIRGAARELRKKQAATLVT